MADLRRLASERTAQPRAHLLIRRSGLFDPDFYGWESGRRFSSLDRAIADYVRRGAAEGHSPHPLVDVGWYTRRVPEAARSRLGPFAHYLGRGAARGEVTHPIVDAKRYLRQVPDATEHPGGILGHFLEHGWRRGLELNAWFDAQGYARRHPEYDGREPAVVHFARTARRRLAEVPDHRAFPRWYRGFDAAASEAFVASVLASFARSRPAGGDAPLVSVIIPTRDRADILPTAIRSVREQTHQRWELLIVDDGSTDATEQVVADIDDERIRYLDQPPSGVSRARNHGLEQARGRYVAYLDSDNAWEPRFLEVMVAFLETSEHPAAYSALEFDRKDETRYRGVPFDRGALLERNYIDCNTLVHERELGLHIGGWDEQLRRTTDWDFAIRLSAPAPLGYAPFIGVRYDHDRERGDRITVREPVGYRLRVRAKHLLDWDAAAGVEEDPDLVSIVVAASGGHDQVRRCVTAVADHTPQPHEIVVVDNGGRGATPYALLALEAELEQVRVRRIATDEYDSIGPDLGVVAARGAVVVLLAAAMRVRPGWLEPLVAPLRAGDAAATQPRMLSPDGTVRSAGYVVPDHGIPYDAFRGFAEHAPEVRASQERQAVNGGCLAARRRDLVAVEGFDPMYLAVLQDVDLCLRLRDATGRPARYVAESTVVRGPSRPRGGDLAVDDQRVFEERWLGRLVPDEAAVLAAADLRPLFYELATGDDTDGHDVHRPVVERVREHPSRRRWAIKIGPRAVDVRDGWGDWHFALALKDVLEAHGQDVSIDLRTAWYRPTAHLDDVVLNLRGIIRYAPNPRHLNLMWLISHPDLVVDTEVARCDHVFVASAPFARRLASRTRVPVEPLLQCTDASRFVPGPREPDAAPVLFVGNSRDVLRPIVRDALAAGLPLRVYGRGWKRLVPDRHVMGTYLANERLPVAYRSAGVVLNDHWEDMRREGFLSNRLFDLAACGARVISDDVPGLEEVFGDLVRVYRDPDDLARLVREVERRDEAEEPLRAQLSERIRREHSFMARAARLVEVVEEHAARDRARGA